MLKIRRSRFGKGVEVGVNGLWTAGGVAAVAACKSRNLIDASHDCINACLRLTATCEGRAGGR